MPNKEWLGRPILSDKHKAELELKSAISQYGMGMDRPSAERAAYNEYVKNHSYNAAAHHYAGMKRAMDAKDTDSAKKHSVMYSLHAKNAGFDSDGIPPQAILELAAKQKEPYRFKPHLADHLVIDKAKLHKTEFYKGDGSWATHTKMFIGGGNPVKIEKPKTSKISAESAIKPIVNNLEQELMTPDPPKQHDPDIGTGHQHIKRLREELGLPVPKWKTRSPIVNPLKRRKKTVSEHVDDALKILGKS